MKMPSSMKLLFYLHVVFKCTGEIIITNPPFYVCISPTELKILDVLEKHSKNIEELRARGEVRTKRGERKRGERREVERGEGGRGGKGGMV